MHFRENIFDLIIFRISWKCLLEISRFCIIKIFLIKVLRIDIRNWVKNIILYIIDKKEIECEQKSLKEILTEYGFLILQVQVMVLLISSNLLQQEQKVQEE